MDEKIQDAEAEKELQTKAVNSGKRKAIIILISLLILYTFYHVCLGLVESVDTTPTGLVEQSSSVILEGVIFRNEEGITSKYKGDLRPYYYNGERVSVDSAVASVYSSKGSKDANEKISALKEELDILKKSNVKGLVSIVDIENERADIESMYTSIMLALSDGDYLRANRIERELLISMNRLAIYEGRVKNYDSEIARVESELDSLYASFKGESEYVFADKGGYIYYSCDGYEDILNSDVLADLTLDSFDNLLKKVKDKPVIDSKYVCKFVYGNIWRVAASCDVATASMLEEGREYKVTLFDVRERELSFTLESIKLSGDNGAVLVFTCSVMPDGFDFIRYQSFRLDISSIEGYRVPKEAMVMEKDEESGEMKTGVYILNASVVQYKKVEIIGESEGYYIVAKNDISKEDHHEYLNINDIIILETKGMYDGRILKR